MLVPFKTKHYYVGGNFYHLFNWQNIIFLSKITKCGPLDIEIISEEFLVMLRQLSYAIKNQLKAPKASYCLRHKGAYNT